MYKIVSQFSVGNYTVLELDRPISERYYRSYQIDGKTYEAEIVYDLPKHVGIKAGGDFQGKILICV